MPLAAAIPLVIMLLVLGAAGSSISATSDDSGSVVMSRQGIFSGISTAEPTSSTAVVTVTNPTAETSQSSAVTSPTQAPRALRIDTLEPQDVTAYSATMRGTVTGGAGSQLFFISSTNRAALAKAAAFTSYAALTANRPTDVTMYAVSVYTPNEQVVRQYLYSLREESTYYYQLCANTTVEGIRCADVVDVTTTHTPYRSTYFNTPTVSLSYATDIGAFEATIDGSYRVNDAEDVTVFLVYGTNQSAVNSASVNNKSYAQVRDANANLDTRRLKARTNQDGAITVTLDDLSRDTTYYYALCAEYSGEEDGLTCSYGYSFTTKDRDRDEPTFATDVVTKPGAITVTSRISMNDYLDGHGFIVYGTNETYLNAVADSWSYSYIYQRGDELQVISLDTDVDGTQVFTHTINDVTVPALYFARTCVEYEQEDQYGYDRLVIDCGTTVPFIVQ